MPLPLLSTDYLSSPTMGGVMDNKTAELYIKQGDALAKTIESQSQTADAQMKAPIITGLYSDAYARIVSGDMTGFASMQKARSLAIGNPVLTGVVDSADKIAGHLANTWLESELYGKKAAINLKNQEVIQKDIADRQDKSLAAAATREDTRTAIALHREEYSQWERDEFQTKKLEEQDKTDWAHQQAAENVRAQMSGEAPRQIPPPPPREHRPPPQLKPVSSEAALPSTGLDISNSGGDMPLFPDSTAPTVLPAVAVNTPPVVATPRTTETFDPESMMTGGVGISTEGPKVVVAGSQPHPVTGALTTDFGAIRLTISEKPSAHPDKLTIDESTGKATSTTTSKAPEAEEAHGIAQQFSSIAGFGPFFEKKALANQKISIVPGEVDKGKAQYYVAQSQDGEILKAPDQTAIEAFNKDPKNVGVQVPTTQFLKPVQFTEKQAESWKKFEELAGKVNIKWDVKEPSPALAELARSMAIDHLKNNPADFESTNRTLELRKVKPITKEEIAADPAAVKRMDEAKLATQPLPSQAAPAADTGTKLTGEDAALQKKIDAAASKAAEAKKQATTEAEVERRNMLEETRKKSLKLAQTQLTKLTSQADKLRSLIDSLVSSGASVDVLHQRKDELISVLANVDKLKSDIEKLSKG